MSNGLSIYTAAFGYFEKVLIILSTTLGGIFIASFAAIKGTPIEIISANFSFAFLLTTGIFKNY